MNNEIEKARVELLSAAVGDYPGHKTLYTLAYEYRTAIQNARKAQDEQIVAARDAVVNAAKAWCGHTSPSSQPLRNAVANLRKLEYQSPEDTMPAAEPPTPAWEPKIGVPYTVPCATIKSDTFSVVMISSDAIGLTTYAHRSYATVVINQSKSPKVFDALKLLAQTIDEEKNQ